MTTIKTLDERLPGFREPCDIILALKDEVAELREALRVADEINVRLDAAWQRCMKEKSELQAKLSAMQAQEPAFYLSEQGQLSATLGFAERNFKGQRLIKLYTAPAAPAQPKLVTPYISQEHFDRAFPDAPITQPKDHEIAKLVNDLTQIATIYHNHQSLRQRISIRVLETVKAAQPLTKESAEKVLDAAELCRRWFVDEVGLTEAHPIVVCVTEAIEIMKGVRDV